MPGTAGALSRGCGANVEATTVVTTATVLAVGNTGVLRVESPALEQATTTRHNKSHLTRFNPLPLTRPGRRS